MKLILDLGSGNTCRNDKGIVREMIDAIASVSTRDHDIVLKWQLFESAPPNIPLERDVFDYAYDYAYGRFETTASVFDEYSLEFLQEYDVPFIKIANRCDLYYLAYNPFNDFIVSVDNCLNKSPNKNVTFMACVSKYPATVAKYEKAFPPSMLKSAISDHTIGWDLYNKYKPQILEKHFVQTRNSGNPDAGAFAVTAEELKEIL